MNRMAYIILLVVGIALLIMPLSVPVFKSNAQYSVLNTGWNGTSEFGKLLYSKGGVSPILGPYDSVGLDGDRGTLVVIGPNLPFTSGEIKALKKFLKEGNTLLLADNFGTGNQLLKGLGLRERFSSKPPLTPVFIKNRDFPITAEIKTPLSSGVSVLVMYKPSVILNPVNPLVTTPNGTYVDGKYGAFAIVDIVKYGRGKVILVSDPGVFTNSLFRENERFIENLLNYMPGPYLIDEAHHRDFNPYSSGTITIRRAVNKRLVFYYVLFIAALAFIVESGVWVKPLEWTLALLKKFFREKTEDIEETVKSLEGEGLDGEVLRKMVREIQTGSKLGGENGR